MSFDMPPKKVDSCRRCRPSTGHLREIKRTMDLKVNTRKKASSYKQRAKFPQSLVSSVKIRRIQALQLGAGYSPNAFLLKAFSRTPAPIAIGVIGVPNVRIEVSNLLSIGTINRFYLLMNDKFNHQIP